MKKGFTIVELLVVIVVIAILATITIVSYNGITKSATDASLKSDLQNTATKLELYSLQNSGYPTTISADDKAESSTNTVTYQSTGTNTYCVSATTKKAGGSKFYITEAGVIQTGTCPDSGIARMSNGLWNTVAVKANGSVYTWGRNNYGQLGDGTTVNKSSPVAVTGLLAGKTVTQVSAGATQVLALTSDGQVYAWGWNNQGQVGDGSTTTRTSPVLISGGALSGKTITYVYAGDYYSLAVASDGTVYGWGTNTYNQLGSGSTSNQLSPIALSGYGALVGKNIKQVSGGTDYAAALDTDGKVYVWGSNTGGQLGDGTTTARPSPITISSSGPLSTKVVTKLLAKGSRVQALTSDNIVYAWGWNGNNELGDGTTTSSSVPKIISNLSPMSTKTISYIGVGQYTSFSIASDGTVYAWGENSTGDVGDGTTTNRGTPVAITNNGSLSGKTIVEIGGGTTNSFARASDGTIHVWGANTYGQVGDGSTSTRTTPVAITLP